MTSIVFTDTMGVPEEYRPKPATSFVPDWYKNMESYITGDKAPDGNGMTTGTLKRCMPVFDSITAGYILTTYVDVYISQRDGISISRSTGRKKKIKVPWYEWPSYGPIQFHPVEQAPEHPLANGFSYPKWINPWSITTPPGYSVMFTAPAHRESVFTILDGVVDTDTYTAPVNFPFVLNDHKFEGLIPAGTPMAQVIPFKRETWEMTIGNNEELIQQNKVTTLLRTKFFDSYKSQFRVVKEYK
jgi:hypothetical protein